MKLRERDRGKLLCKHKENLKGKLNEKKSWMGSD